MGTIQIKEKIIETESSEIVREEKKTKLESKKTEENLRLYEDKTKREKNVKHYKRSDGSFEAHYFNEPVHFYDEGEQRFKSIDNRLCECRECLENGAEFEGFTNRAGEVKARFSKQLENEELFNLKKGQYEVSWRYIRKKETLNAEKFCPAEIQSKEKIGEQKQLEDEILYREVEENIDLQYVLNSQQVKENIIIHRKKENYQFEFEMRLKNLNAELRKDEKALDLTVQKIKENGEMIKEVIFTIPMPYMYDKKGKESDEVEYVMEEKTGGVYQFFIKANQDWINHPEREFPVVIDPIIIYNTSNTIDTRTINSKDYYLTGYGHSLNEVGLHSIYGPYRTYLQIKNISNSAQVIQATLNLYQINHTVNQYDTINKSFEVRKILSNWSPSNIKWSDNVQLSDEIFGNFQFDTSIDNANFLQDEYPISEPISIDVTKVLRDPNQKGIAIKCANEIAVRYDYFIRLASQTSREHYRPQLIVNYREKNSLVSNQQQKNSLGRAGTGVLDLYTKNLQFIHEDISLGGEKMPLNIQHIFNSRNCQKTNITSSSGFATQNIGMGRGWKTNMHQYICTYPNVTSIDDSMVPKYIYIDQYGQEIILNKIKLNANSYEITDENGKGLTYDETNRILSDKSGNKLYFDSLGRLFRISDAFNVNTIIGYISGSYLINYVTDGSGRNAQFYYEYSTVDGEQKLTKISYGQPTSRNIFYEYDSNYRLTKITYQNGNSSQYSYGESGNTYYLTSIRDQTGYRMNYLYSGNTITLKESTNLSSIKHNVATTVSEKYGNKIEIEYGDNRTKIKTKDGKSAVHLFLNSGMSYASYIENTSSDNINRIQAINDLQFQENFKDQVFAATTQRDKKNYVLNPSFENGITSWTISSGSYSGVVSTASADGSNSFKIPGENNVDKRISQRVIVPSNEQSFVLTAFAKGNSLPLNETTKFQISAQLFYTDGNSENEEISHFNAQDNNWQVAAVGICRKKENLNKSISYVIIQAEYSKNLGDVYFDNFTLTCGKYSRQTIQNEYLLKNGAVYYALGGITGIRYTTEGFLATHKTVTEPTFVNGRQILTIEDVDKMIKQKVSPDKKGMVILGGKVIESEALVGETFWGDMIAKIAFIIGGYEVNIFDLTIVSKQQIEIEDGSLQTAVMKTDLNEQVSSSTITDEYGKEFTTYYSYDKGKMINSEDYRNIKKDYLYNSSGNLTEQSEKNRLDTDATNYTRNQYFYNSNNTFIERTCDERGVGFETKTDYSQTYARLESITLPDGQKINYNYPYNDDILNSISTTVGTDTMSNSYGYTRGLLTKLVTNNNEYLFEYDGFRNLTKTIVNGKTFVESEFKRDSAYTSADENSFNYDKETFHNGAEKTYSEKTIYNKEDRVICVKSTENNSTQDLIRNEYDSFNRLKKSSDYSFGAGNPLQHNYFYRDNGMLDSVQLTGNYNGLLKSNYDKNDRLISKKVNFDEDKNYAYYYDKIGNSTIIDNRISSIVLPTSAKVDYQYDSMNRFKKRITNTYCLDSKLTEEFDYMKVLPDDDDYRTTNFVSGARYYGRNFYANVFYHYDEKGNILVAGNNSYQYDGISRIIRENNADLGFTKLFEYDGNGNLVRIKKYDYSTNTIVSNLLNEVITTYTYGNAVHRDQLTHVKSMKTSTLEIFEEYGISQYDGVGNPCNYKLNIVKWNRGRNLAEYGGHQYKYNAEGIRQEKITSNGTVHKYYLERNRIHKEKRGTKTLWYYYDQSGVTGLEYNGEKFYFQKNIQNDVERIFNEAGELIARYAYDAWGNHKVFNAVGTEITSSDFIGNVNPFRYRSYYFDSESGFYYLNSRYYDPKLGRFINADDPRVAGVYSQTINGLNLYSYCLNNPVMHTDENGRWIGSMIWLMVALAGMVFGADAFIRSLANYQRNPSGANLIMLIVTGVFLALSIVEVVFTAVKFVQTLKSVSSYSSAGSLAQGADEVVVTNADDLFFESMEKLDAHFLKHKNDFAGIYKTADEYLSGANYVINNGIYIPEMNGYIKFFGKNGKANYAFVGLTKNGQYITTYGVRDVASLKKIPWLNT